MTEPVFHEDWYSAECLEMLARLAVAVMVRPTVRKYQFIEIGSWEGKSTIAIAQRIAPRVLVAVDTWLGSPDHESADIAHSRDVLAQFKANLAATKVSNVRIEKQDWRDLEWKQPLAFVHLDGDHAYEAVSAQIETLRPLIAPGGILCGHDYWQYFPGVVKAVATCLPWHAQLNDQPLWWWENV